MSRPERVEESLPAFEAFVNYSVDTGEKPASYGGINTIEADKKRTGKYQEYKMPIYNGRASPTISHLKERDLSWFAMTPELKIFTKRVKSVRFTIRKLSSW